MTATPYAIIDSEGRCINRTLWDGETEWQPPAGCTAVPDLDGTHSIWQEPESDPDPLAALTPEQRTALLALLQQDA
jgi:hypothetical protein